MKKSLICLICVIVLVSLCSLCLGETGYVRIHESGNVNVRSAPDAGSAAVGSAGAGQIYEFSAVAANGWYYITLDDGKQGYISPKLASLVSMEDAEQSGMIRLSDGAMLKVGDFIVFGAYEQDNNWENGKEPIEWRVLEIKDGEALLISRYALDSQPYSARSGIAMWSDATLRTWLSSNFYNTAFSNEEKAVIVTHSVENWRDVNTEDPVILLDCDQAKKLFKNHADRQAQATSYAVAQGVYISNTFGNNVHWWLRQHSWEHATFGTFVATSGGVMTCGGESLGRTTNYQLAVRPAVYVDCSKLSSLTKE